MKNYPISMTPGPVSVPDSILKAYQSNFGSADMEPEFLELYLETEANLQKLMGGTSNRIAIMTGEGMIALWAALKSCLVPGDQVLALSTGVFGEGFGDMVKSVGADVTTMHYDFDETLQDWEAIEAMIRVVKPKMITAIHCETPSGTLNPIERLGKLKKQYDVDLLVVDAVASLGGAPVLMDEWGVDLLLGGSQKVLSMPPSMSMVGISKRAWDIIEEVGYQGYDALLPYKTAQDDFYFPYTPNWHGVAAMKVATDLLLRDGLDATFERHARVAKMCQEGVLAMGLDLFVKEGSVMAPTVTAVKVPEGMSWQDLNARMRSNGLVCGGSYGKLSGKVFRLGHMGSQADEDLMERALEALRKSIA